MALLLRCLSHMASLDVEEVCYEYQTEEKSFEEQPESVNSVMNDKRLLYSSSSLCIQMCVRACMHALPIGPSEMALMCQDIVSIYK